MGADSLSDDLDPETQERMSAIALANEVIMLTRQVQRVPGAIKWLTDIRDRLRAYSQYKANRTYRSAHKDGDRDGI